jgi:hypothetical protein
MMIRPKILYITDDLYSDGSRLVEHYARWYDITIISKKEMLTSVAFSDYDATVIDYGMIGDDGPLLQRIYQSGSKMVWCGGMPGHYNADARKVHPRLKFLHNLPWCQMSDLGWMLGTMFGDDDEV